MLDTDSQTDSIAPTVKEHVIQPPHNGRRAFNASIILWDDRLWMAYRVSHNDRPDSLRIAELDRKTFEVRSDRPLEVPVAEGWGAEDPRLFEHNGVLHVAWTAADYHRRPWCATMFYGPITWWHCDKTVGVRRAYQPRYGFNQVDQREKNWQFWSAGGCLFAQYSPSPHRVIQLHRDEVIGEWITPGFEWEHGTPSGGTPPIRTSRGTMLTFFHSFIESPTRQRIYSFGAMEFSAVAPFEVRSVSPHPILTAHDNWPTASDEWSPLCVFPSGVVESSENYLVSAGVNDSGIRIFELTPDDMPMVEPKRIPVEETGYFRAIQSFLFGGRVRTVGEIIEADIETARKLLNRKWIQPYESETA